ncbi:MAG: electron transport complex subunit RsxE [Bacilli bacterium]|nr:electron transport complex subunit RsxE [Bacilli bacterium]
MSNQERKEAFLSPLWKTNPLFISLLGMCPALAVTKTLEAAFGMGILFTLVLVCSNVLISALRKWIPEEVRTPSYIVVIATFVTLVKMFAEAFLPELYSTLGVFVSLLVVNCIVLGRAEAFASKNGVLPSLLDGIGNGIGYTIAICLIAVIREVLGSGRLTFGATFTFLADLNGGEKIRVPLLKGEGYDLSMSFFSSPAGGFLVLGIVLAIIVAVTNAKENKKKADARIAAKKAKELAAANAAKEEAK